MTIIAKKIIAFDLDGTLLNDQNFVPESTQLYLRELKEKGHIIVAISGRILRSVLETLDDGNFINFAIASNGSYIFDTNAKMTVLSYPLNKTICSKIFYTFKDTFKRFNICDKIYYHQYVSGVPLSKSRMVTKIQNIEETINQIENIYKLELFFKNTDEYINVKNKINEASKEVCAAVMQDTSSMEKWIEIMPIHINKLAALLELAEIVSIKPTDIIAFGDGMNDIDMIKGVGIGVAMENALPEIKAISISTTLSNNHCGVEMWLRQYFLDEDWNN